MKEHIHQLVATALESVKAGTGLTVPDDTIIQIERTRDERHGEFATNIALSLAKAAQQKPRDLAAEILKHLPESEYIEKIEIAGPGFINFFLTQKAYLQIIPDILNSKRDFGRNDMGRGQAVLLEFVSTNPTGPLHVGHGRGAAYGASVANLLEAAGYDVTCEYYINDAGRQMDILATSVWLRYLELCGFELRFPEKAYRGEYIRNIAGQILEAGGQTFHKPPDAAEYERIAGEEGDTQLDSYISLAKERLGEVDYRFIHGTTLTVILEDIKDDLSEFGIFFDNWFSEQSLLSSGEVLECITALKDGGEIYEKEGAQWFRSTFYGDEKDRVVVRENGQLTYFASDIAYHLNKYNRGFSKMINIWGADHHGYISRVKAAVKALNRDPDQLEILLVQFAVLFRGTEKISMSTRAADYVTLRDLRQEVGNDAARFFYVTRKSEQHLDFDLELAKSQSNDNPVYYIQYAHARIASVMKQLSEKGFKYSQENQESSLIKLTQAHEQQIMKSLALYPEVIRTAAENHEPHQICFYLRELANIFHSYYNSHQFIVDDAVVRNARISLILAVQQVIRNGLEILGVSAPDKM